ncbi:MAG: SDR family oxidoreductase, partial [Nitratireductor sp.]
MTTNKKGGDMAEEKKQGYVRPPSAESQGEAPGRGRLNGRRILVVGGGQRVLDAATDPVGNGRAMSLLFAREGAAVAVADMNAEAASETVRQIEADGGKATAIAADISKPDDIKRMIDEAVSAMGGLDGMVLNVGIGVGGLGLDGVSAEDWTKALDVNLRG